MLTTAAENEVSLLASELCVSALAAGEKTEDAGDDIGVELVAATLEPRLVNISLGSYSLCRW
jgi:hypothetical protein